MKSAEELAREIYLDWTGVPKPNDKYPIGPHAMKLVDSISQAIRAERAARLPSRDQLQKFCDDQFQKHYEKASADQIYDWLSQNMSWDKRKHPDTFVTNSADMKAEISSLRSEVSDVELLAIARDKTMEFYGATDNSHTMGFQHGWRACEAMQSKRGVE
jgi:malate synthase